MGSLDQKVPQEHLEDIKILQAFLIGVKVTRVIIIDLDLTRGFQKYIILRSSGCYTPFLLAAAQGIGGPFGPSLGPFGPSRGPKGPPLPFTKR